MVRPPPQLQRARRDRAGFDALDDAIPPVRTPDPGNNDDVAALALRSAALYDRTDVVLGLLLAHEIAKRH